MATASVPNTFINGQNADANQVNANFASIVNWLNTNVIQPDLANFSIFPTLPSSTPTSPYQAVHKNYVDLWLPAGSIIQYGGTLAPSGWLLCDGTTYDGSNTIYSRLFAAIGLTYGGSASSFQVPDLRGRVPVGYGAGSGLTSRSLNDKSGSETVTLTAAQSGLVGHNHTQNPHNHTQNPHDHDINTTWIGTATSHAHNNLYDYVSEGTNGASTQANTNSIQSTTATNNAETATNNAVASANASEAHGNMQPFIVVNFIIKL